MYVFIAFYVVFFKNSIKHLKNPEFRFILEETKQPLSCEYVNLNFCL